MITLLESHWDALSNGPITLKQLKNLLSNVNEDSVEQFKRIEPLVICEIFKNRVESLKLLNKKEWYQLSQDGFIPQIKGNICERFGFIQKGQWVEWNIPSINIMRLYWSQLFASCTCKQLLKMETLCKNLIFTLPGKLQTCEQCQWPCNESNMYNEKCCTFCMNPAKLKISNKIIHTSQ